jgi:hypothetical protein
MANEFPRTIAAVIAASAVLAPLDGGPFGFLRTDRNDHGATFHRERGLGNGRVPAGRRCRLIKPGLGVDRRGRPHPSRGVPIPRARLHEVRARVSCENSWLHWLRAMKGPRFTNA